MSTPSSLYLCAIISGQPSSSQTGGTNRRNASEGFHRVFIETRPTGALGTLLDQELRLVHNETTISPSRSRRLTSLVVSEVDNSARPLPAARLDDLVGTYTVSMLRPAV